MRYLGNKTQLLEFIENTILKYNIEGEVFADFFAGTGAVGDFFKNRYQIYSNDYLYFSSIINKAKLYNNTIPSFKKFKETYNCDPFTWLNSKNYKLDDNFFVFHNYSLAGNRMYFTPENAIKIDGIRLDIEEFYQSNILTENEYYFLIASLLESVTKVSNTSGTYQAFFKFWESRALKELILSPIQLNEVLSVDINNQVFNKDANILARQLQGDIAYIDPPYTTTQYTNSYHVLETIAKYDYPEIFGKTGRRMKREFSAYSNKSNAIIEFEDLLRQINFKHILISYSNHSIIELDTLIKLCEKFAKDGEVYVEYFNYKSYSTNNQSYKEKIAPLKEVIIYFKKDFIINKSPLNYSGSKDKIVTEIIKVLPKHLEIFVDAMGGAFNVGANITALEKVIYNEYNPFIFEIIEYLLTTEKIQIVNEVEYIVDKFKLKKKDKKNYNILRDYYNDNQTARLLYVLQIYSFQNMIRFNQNLKMNVPIGNNEYNPGTKERILNFHTKSSKFELINKSYLDIDYLNYPKDTVFYFDPPYFITKAEYNDGKRGLDGWNVESETLLLDYLLKLNSEGYKFILSNILSHGNKKHNLLIEWIKTHNFNIIEVGKTGIKYPRIEVLITNYKV